MKKVIEKLKNAVLLLLVFTVATVVGITDVFAAEPPKTLEVGSSTNLPTYINGLNIPRKILSDGTESYCLSLSKATTQNTTVTLYGERDAGFAYIIENGYPSKSITGDKNKDIYITQVAVWWYLDETTGSTNLNNYVRNVASDPYNIRGYAKKLVNGAVKAKNKGYPNPKISASTTSKTLSIGKTKKYYISNAVTVSTTDVDSYQVKLTNAPSGSFTADTAGNVKTKFNAGEKFVVYVPVGNVNNTSVDFKATITGTKKYNKVYEYRPSNKNVQEIIPTYLYPTTKTVNTSINFNIFKSKVVITKVDKSTNKQLAGATLVLKDSKGGVVTSWKTTGSAHVIENLPKGTYTIQETAAPAGYELNTTPLKFTISDTNRTATLTFYNHKKETTKGSVKIIKVSKETGKPLVGAKIVVKNEAGKVIASWTSTNDYHVIEDLPNGKYTAQETEAPEGYILDTTPQEFTITDNNKNITLKLYNKAASKVVSIIKIDQDTKEIIAGAVLVIKDSTGKEIARFTTTNSAYTIENIANGTYTVEEVSAPEGYVLSDEKVTFTIDDKNRTAQVSFANKKEITTIVDVPNTNSNASVIFYIVGGLILATTAGFVYYNAKKEQQ